MNLTSGALSIAAGGSPMGGNPVNRPIFRATFRMPDGTIPACTYPCPHCGELRHSVYACYCRCCGCRIDPYANRVQVSVEATPPARDEILDRFAKVREVLRKFAVPKTKQRVYDPVRNEIVEVPPTPPEMAYIGKIHGINVMTTPTSRSSDHIKTLFKRSGGSAIVQASIGEHP